MLDPQTEQIWFIRLGSFNQNNQADQINRTGRAFLARLANATEAFTMKLSAVQPSQPLRRSRPRYGVFGEGE